MRTIETGLEGLRIVELASHRDERGGFDRLWCRDEFAAADLAFRPIQSSLSTNLRAGTLRGMHWQEGAGAETKLVRVVHGAIFDVAVDLRPGSPTRFRWYGLWLEVAVNRALLIPPGFAHGFLSQADDSAVLYMMDAPHEPAAARGARWDDPRFAIDWPGAPVVISERDRTWPDFGEAR